MTDLPTDTYRRIARVDLKFDIKGAHAHLSEEVKDLITKVSVSCVTYDSNQLAHHHCSSSGTSPTNASLSPKSRNTLGY